MTTEIRLGKIRSIELGYGGYQDAQFGITIDFEGDGWGVGTFVGHWSFEPDKYCKWTNEDRLKVFADVMVKAKDWISAAKKTSLSQLKNVPVEITLEDFALKSWRILTEVL